MPYDCWLTPPDILDRVRRLFDGTIDFDPSSNFVAQEYVNATTFCISPEDAHAAFDDHSTAFEKWQGRYIVDGLSTSWNGGVFCNPPYSAGNIDKFVRKGISEWNDCYRDAFANIRRGRVKQMIFLVNSSTDTKWYHDLLTHCDTALLWRSRIKFLRVDGAQASVKDAPRYASTMFYFGQYSDRFMDLFADKGTFIKVAR